MGGERGRWECAGEQEQELPAGGGAGCGVGDAAITGGVTRAGCFIMQALMPRASAMTAQLCNRARQCRPALRASYRFHCIVISGPSASCRQKYGCMPVTFLGPKTLAIRGA